MKPERSHHHDVDPHDPHFLSHTGQTDQEIVSSSPDAGRVDALITKASELDVSTLNNVETRFLHPSVWISLGVSALIAMLYLFLESQ